MIDIHHLLPLVGLTFLLGLRHGMDPDHLAVVDNITRYNVDAAPARARWCGLFFSLGHGAMVTAVAVLLATLAVAHHIPPWVEWVGQAVSIAFLLAVGSLNLRLFLRAGSGDAVAPHGLRSGLFLRASRVSHPVAISLIGAAFAISMDTLSQAAVFSMAASGRFAWGFACLLGGVFTLGMLAVDAANGFWVYRMIRSLDRRGHAGTRALTLAIALMSLALAALGMFRLGTAGLDHWYDDHALMLGAAAVLVPALAFALCRRSAPPAL